MASIVPEGDGYRVHVYYKGVRRSKVFKKHKDAKAWGAKTYAELTDGKDQAAPRPGKGGLHKLFDRFATEVCPNRQGGATEAKRLERLKREIPDEPLARLDAPVLAEWRDRRLKEVKPASVRRDMALLRAVFEQARREWRLLVANPLADVKRPPAPPPRKRLISQAEIDAVVQALHYRDDLPVVLKMQEVAVLFLLAVETAMRDDELRRCVVRGRVAYLDKTKNGDEREVPLSHRAVELFGKVPKGFTVGAGSRDTLFREARKAAKLSGFTFHDARAVALTRLSKKFTVLELARIVGHRDPRSLMIYYRESAESLADKF